MLRILVLIVLIWILYQLIKRVVAQINTHNSSQFGQQKPEQKIVKCAQCGCHVPETDTKLINSKIICNNPECSNIESNNTPNGD